MEKLTEGPHGFIPTKDKPISVDWGWDQFGDEGFLKRLVLLLNTGRLAPDKYYPDGIVFDDEDLELIKKSVREGEENSLLRDYIKYTLPKIDDEKLKSQVLHYIPMKYIAREPAD